MRKRKMKVFGKSKPIDLTNCKKCEGTGKIVYTHKPQFISNMGDYYYIGLCDVCGGSGDKDYPHQLKAKPSVWEYIICPICNSEKAQKFDRETYCKSCGYFLFDRSFHASENV